MQIVPVMRDGERRGLRLFLGRIERMAKGRMEKEEEKGKGKGERC